MFDAVVVNFSSNQYICCLLRPKSAAYETRLRQIEHDVETTKTYSLTETELIYGAKLAWRNSARCIGRIQWSKLQVSVRECVRPILSDMLHE